MIIITKIASHLYFPVVHFSLRNELKTPLEVSEFCINVHEVKLDKTPVLEFNYHVIANENISQHYVFEPIGDLEIYGINKGYGSALNCKVQIAEPELQQFFTYENLECILDIPSGQNLTVCKLPVKFPNGITTRFSLSKINLKATYEDEYNRPHSAEFEAGSKWNDCKLELDGNGFHLHHFRSTKIQMMMMPRKYYCAMIDFEKGIHQRIYPRERVTEPNTTDNLQIMIGCNKSATLTLSFSLKTSEGEIIETDKFNLQIYNPKEEFRPHQCFDSEQLYNRFSYLSEKPNKTDEEGRECRSLIVTMAYEFKDYPFYNYDDED